MRSYSALSPPPPPPAPSYNSQTTCPAQQKKTKTEHLQGDAWAFRREAKRARRVMWWRNVKMWAALGGAVALILFVLLVSFCGATFARC